MSNTDQIASLRREIALLSIGIPNVREYFRAHYLRRLRAEKESMLETLLFEENMTAYYGADEIARCDALAATL